MRVPKLEAAVKLLVQGEDEPALEALVDCWRDWKATELAGVIEQLAARLASKLPPVTGAGTTSDRQAWLALAEEQRTATLPRLLEVLPKANGLIARERVEALRRWPASPVLAAGLAAWLEQPPFGGKARARCVPPALEALEAQRDPRVVPVLTKVAAADHRGRTIRALGLGSWKTLRALSKRAADWAEAPVPHPAEAAALAKLRERMVPAPVALPTVNIEELYAAVYAQPDDDTARLILADVLQELGDPRGELIALQVGRAAAGGTVSKRERQVLGTWGRDWLGPLNPALMREGIVFERGFLSQCAYNGEQLPQLTQRPEWATVTHLELAHAAMQLGGSHGLILAPMLKSVRHLSGVGTHSDLRAMAETGRPLRWESLSLKLWSLDATARAMFAGAPLPSLTRLGLHAASPAPLNGLTEDEVARIFDGSLGKTLQHLELAMPPRMFGVLIDFAGTKKLASIAIHPTSRELSLRFDVASRSVVIHFDPVSRLGMEAVVTAMKSVRRGTIDRVLLRVTQRAKIVDGVLKTPTSSTPLKALKQALGGVELVLPD